MKNPWRRGFGGKQPQNPPRYILVQDTFYNDWSPHKTREMKAVKEKTGIAPDELFDLCVAFGAWMAPRLEMFILNVKSHPCCFKSLKSWRRCLYKMLYTFRRLADDSGPYVESDKKFWQGYRLFAKYMFSLWS